MTFHRGMYAYPLDRVRADLRAELLELEASGHDVEVVDHVGTSRSSPLCRIERGGVAVGPGGPTMDQAVTGALEMWRERAPASRSTPWWTVKWGPDVLSEHGGDVERYVWTLERPGCPEHKIEVRVTHTLIAATDDQWPGAARAIATMGRSEAEAMCWWEWPPRTSTFYAIPTEHGIRRLGRENGRP